MEKQKQLLKQIYGFEFPESFFNFYEFTKKVPKATFQGLDSIMGMGDAFNVFSETKMEDFNPVKQSRYYNDPPEFFTILRGYTDGLHWDYYLDDFNDLKNMYVVSYYSNDAFELNPVGNTIFEAFRQELEGIYASVPEGMKYNPN